MRTRFYNANQVIEFGTGLERHEWEIAKSRYLIRNVIGTRLERTFCFETNSEDVASLLGIIRGVAHEEEEFTPKAARYSPVDHIMDLVPSKAPKDAIGAAEAAVGVAAGATAEGAVGREAEKPLKGSSDGSLEEPLEGPLKWLSEGGAMGR
ncbi:hypothetical protein BDZ91DRAFT_844515 [Kalaharituber pfeilii]|nr:hypothetical protein BDZ91DRAFT_844515 [Kalaharituber pfeilii]